MVYAARGVMSTLTVDGCAPAEVSPIAHQGMRSRLSDEASPIGPSANSSAYPDADATDVALCTPPGRGLCLDCQVHFSCDRSYR